MNGVQAKSHNKTHISKRHFKAWTGFDKSFDQFLFLRSRMSSDLQVEIANFLEQKAGGIVEAFEKLNEIAPGAVPKAGAVGHRGVSWSIVEFWSLGPGSTTGNPWSTQAASATASSWRGDSSHGKHVGNVETTRLDVMM